MKRTCRPVPPSFGSSTGSCSPPSPPPLLQKKIKSITKIEVRDTTAEIEPTTGSMVQAFSTDTVGKEFLFAPGGSGRGRWDTIRPAGTNVAPSAKPIKPDV